MLQPLALRLFSVWTSSAPSERNFSAFGHIWNSSTSSFTFKTAQKMTYVYYNLRALHSNLVDRYEGIDYGYLQYMITDDELHRT